MKNIDPPSQISMNIIAAAQIIGLYITAANENSLFLKVIATLCMVGMLWFNAYVDARRGKNG